MLHSFYCCCVRALMIVNILLHAFVCTISFAIMCHCSYRAHFLSLSVSDRPIYMSADQGFSPKAAGVITMCSFVLFGFVPLLPYLVALIPGVNMAARTQLILSIGMTVTTLFALGAFKVGRAT